MEWSAAEVTKENRITARKRRFCVSVHIAKRVLLETVYNNLQTTTHTNDKQGQDKLWSVSYVSFLFSKTGLSRQKRHGAVTGGYRL